MGQNLKNLLMPLFLMGCFPVDFQEVKRPLRTKSVKRPIKAGKRPINERKRPIKAKVLVGVSVACLMGCFREPPPWRKTAPLKRPIKRSMRISGDPPPPDRQSLAFSECGQLNSTWNECCTNERQPRDSNRGTTNAGSVRTNFFVLEGDVTANEC